jgi:hypothetical protein
VSVLEGNGADRVAVPRYEVNELVTVMRREDVDGLVVARYEVEKGYGSERTGVAGCAGVLSSVAREEVA